MPRISFKTIGKLAIRSRTLLVIIGALLASIMHSLIILKHNIAAIIIAAFAIPCIIRWCVALDITDPTLNPVELEHN